MVDMPIFALQEHTAFLASPRKHVLMPTNHGIQEWEVTPGLPDTGGQVVFVNNLSDALVKAGFKVTIENRGGYPHPLTGKRREGIHYKDAYQRMVYLEDGLDEFVCKEDMHEQMPGLLVALRRFIDDEGTPVELIISHYWDGAQLGVLYNRSLQGRVKHVWVPHSLGAIKKRNVPPARWEDLRIEERIAVERNLITDLDGVAATSSRIRQSLKEDYGYIGPPLFLPPAIDPGRYHPRQVPDSDEVWDFLSRRSGLRPEAVRKCKIVTEISRTDVTKRKDLLIRAFAAIQRRIPNSLLVVSIDENAGALARDLMQLIRSLNLQGRVAVVGSIPEWLPTVYAVTDVYCTPSVMEGFGMSAQEAAASGVPVVASHLVPFVSEYLLGEDVEVCDLEGSDQPVKRGRGAVVVQTDHVDGFAYALEMLLTDDELRKEMGANAYHITIPYFTWSSVVATFLDQIGVRPEDAAERAYASAA